MFRYEQARRVCITGALFVSSYIAQGLTRNTEVWWRLRHENVIPLLGIVHDDRYGYLGAMVTPVRYYFLLTFSIDRIQWYKNLSVDVYLSNSEQPVSIANRIDLVGGLEVAARA